MKFTVLTLFPEIIESYCSQSIMKRAIEKNFIEVTIVNIRDYAQGVHKTCDDEPYGGGSGMILKPEPIALALDALGASKIHTVFPTPCAPLFTQNDARCLVQQKEIILICGRYEGIDERIIDMYVSQVFSVGEYVLSSGEIASLVIIDSVYRLIDGVISKESLREESYNNELLEYPQYTRPAVFRDRKVPEILLSGNHNDIEKWRLSQSLTRTNQFRKKQKNK